MLMNSDHKQKTWLLVCLTDLVFWVYSLSCL